MYTEQDYIDAWLNPSDELLTQFFTVGQLQDGSIKQAFKNLKQKRHVLAEFNIFEMQHIAGDARYMVEIHHETALKDILYDIRELLEKCQIQAIPPQQCFLYPSIYYSHAQKRYIIALHLRTPHGRKTIDRKMDVLHMFKDCLTDKTIHGYLNQLEPWEDNPNLLFRLLDSEKERMKKDIANANRALKEKAEKLTNEVNKFFSA